MAFPYATLCVQGIKDGTSRSAIEAQFEEYGRVVDVTITPNKHMRGVPDSKIALVEFAKKEDARRAMQALNGRHVQGKCVMIRFARSAPGVRPPTPLPRHGAPELIPQTANRAAMLAAKFMPADKATAEGSDGATDQSPRRHSKDKSKDRKRNHSKDRTSKDRTRERSRNRSGDRSRDRKDSSRDRKGLRQASAERERRSRTSRRCVSEARSGGDRTRARSEPRGAAEGSAERRRSRSRHGRRSSHLRSRRRSRQRSRRHSRSGRRRSRQRAH
mmetsp:Transcript_115908/g.322735  ORF Transcript_115908/g.322735 Transcript_115908/m.322735 type:complete len:273 (-) Transcript_115908:377-1195(-)